MPQKKRGLSLNLLERCTVMPFLQVLYFLLEVGLKGSFSAYNYRHQQIGDNSFVKYRKHPEKNKIF